MALTLIQSAQLAANNGEFKRAGVLTTFARSSPLLAAMPMVQVAGNSYAWTREVSLGSVGFRAVNGVLAESAGATEQRSVGLKIIGGDLDVDNFLVQSHGPTIRSAHEEMKAALLAQTISHQIIKGRTSSDVNGFDGLQSRYGGGFGGSVAVDAGENAGQIILNNATGAALSIKNLDEAITLVENPTHLLMSRMMKVLLTAYLRNSSSISTSRDEFGRIITSYAGLPILEADQLGITSGLEQLAFNEGTGSASTNTSIYVLSLSDMGLFMATNGGVTVRDLGELNTKPCFRTRVEMYANLVDAHPRCVARVAHISNAAVAD
jgi:hypothetical protein